MESIIDKKIDKPSNVHNKPLHYRGIEFRKLQDQWYSRLKQSGFNDIECDKAGLQDSRYLKRHNGTIKRLYCEATEEHYRRCRIHLHHHSFRIKSDKVLFDWYTDGKSYRQIVDLFRRKYRKRRSIFYLFERVKKLKTEMDKVKYWEEIDEIDEEATDMEVGRLNKIY